MLLENFYEDVRDFVNIATQLKWEMMIRNVIYKTQEPMGAFLDEMVWAQSFWSDCMPDGRMV